MDTSLYRKLDPARFPNMSLQMAAILGFVLDREFTTPTLDDIQVSPDGHVLAWPTTTQDIGHSMHLGAAADLRAKLQRLGMAAGLDRGEWCEFAEAVRLRLGMQLGGDQAGEDRA